MSLFDPPFLLITRLPVVGTKRRRVHAMRQTEASRTLGRAGLGLRLEIMAPVINK